MGLVLIVVVTAFIGVELFSEKIYMMRTQDLIKTEIEHINEVVQNEDAQTIMNQLDAAAFRLGASVTLYSTSEDVLYSSSQRGGGFGMMGGNGIGRGKVSGNDSLDTYTTMGGKELLTYKTSLVSGDQLLIQLAEEKMTDALIVFQHVLLYVGLLSSVVALLASYLLSKHFSRPIVEIKELAHQISQFDFKGVYSEKRSDEIGDLGRHLNQLSKELEHKINQLEIELHKEKSMDVMRTQFVAQASHELQTPLTVLRNYTEALQDGMVSEEELSGHYGVMTDEIDSMSGLVTGLLDLSQLKSGHFRLEFENFDIEALIEDELKRIQHMVERDRVTIEKKLLHQQIWIHGDPKRLRQAFRNLVENSLKHSTGKVMIKSEVINKTYSISIENTGEPIAEKELKTVWAVFSKAQGNYKKGRGIGLAIVKAIIEGHGGSYGIENTDKGVRSYFELAIK